MRGVVDYSPHPTVAILDSQRPGESHKGIPVVGSVADALAVRADDGTRRGRHAGRTLPAGLARPAEGLDRRRPRRRERPARVHLRRSRARRAGDAPRRRAPRPAQAARRTSTCRPARTSSCRPRPCSPSVPTVRSARRRSRSSSTARRSARGLEVAVRPDRPDGRRDRRLGHRDRRGRRRLHRRGRRAARRRGRRAWGRAALRRGPGLALASGLLGRHARAHARIGAARVRALPRGGRDGDRGLPRLPAAAARGRSSSCTSARRFRPARLGSRRSRSTRARSATRRPVPRRPRSRRRPAFRPTTRSGSARKVLDAVLTVLQS